MTAFLQAVGAALIAVILCVALSDHGKHIPMMLSLAVCSMILLAAVSFLQPVMELVAKLQEMSRIEEDLLAVVFKAVGIGMIAELASLICSDSGNGALGRAVEILASAAVLWLSVPLMTALLELIQSITGDL